MPRLIDYRSVETTTTEDAYASKPNIVLDDSVQGTNPRIRRFEATVAAPGASGVVLDTGNLLAGEYKVDCRFAYQGTAATGKELIVQHRDAADAATVDTLGTVEARADVGQGVAKADRITVATDESIRVVNGATAGGAGSIAEAVLVITKL